MMAHNNSGGIRKASRYHRLDDIPTNTFTPQTYQIQLLDVALMRNTLLCLGCSQSKVFLALMVAKELASSTRHSVNNDHQVIFYLTDSEEEVDGLFQTLPHHTDLQVGCCPVDLSEDHSPDEGTSDGKAFQEWSHLLESSNILICYGPVFLAAVQNNYVRLKDVNLLIFDDCHRSVERENHAYAEIVAHIRTIPVNSQPHILGVTASIAGTDCDDPSKLRETILSMEKTMHASAETSMLLLSERFGCRPRESVIKCTDYDYDTEQLSLRATIEDLLEQNVYFFSNCHICINAEVDNRDPSEIPAQVLSQCLNVLSVLGTWCTFSISEYFVMQLEKILKCERNEIHKRFLRCVITSLRLLIKVFEKNFHPDYDVDELLEYTTPKVRELVTVLRNYKPELDFVIINNGDSYNGDDDFSDLSDDDSSMSGSDDDENNAETSKKKSSKPVHIAVKRTADGGHEQVVSFTEEEEKSLCGVIFVENRYIAFGLNKVIEEVCSWDENLCFVKSCHITGQGLRGTNGKQKIARNFKRQEEALRKFRTQECNLVIATLELEEGVDIPKCNLVIRFDPPKDYRSYTLSKGRARARDALFVILLDQQNYDHFESSLKVFKGIEQVLLGERTHQQALALNMDEDSDDETDSDIAEKDLLPPYCTVPGSPSSPQVTMQGSIALINRYCAKLPSDAFTHLTPQCRIQKVAGKPARYRAFLRLPINSPIKEELQGPEMDTKKLAKMAVALKMCEILHAAGELDENLFPVGKEMFLYEEEEEWGDEEDLTGQARPGTTKRKQYYVKKVADALVQSQPKPGKPCFLYLINLQLTGPITDEQNTRGRVIYAPEDTVQTLGIILSKKIPQVPNFPVYTRSGEVTVSIDLLQSSLTYSDSEISRLLKFHHFVFSGVLHLEKDPMEFDPGNADCGLVVVPLNGKDQLEIDWPFVDKVIQFLDVKKQPGFSRKNPEEPFTFCIDEFKDAVVMPSYRNIDQPQHFYVAEILNDLNPLSSFPSPELYKTFQDYYTTKYALVITDPKQPLLDVDHTSARLNLLTPRYMNQKGVALPTSSAETKRARRENLQQKQILVPELCDIHVFPASLWRKTVCLPAILYRANNLLLAEELRRKISKETGIGVEMLPKYFSFPQLDFGFETSPEKLKEAELNSSKKSDQSSPNGKTVSENVDTKSKAAEKDVCTGSVRSLMLEGKSEESNTQPVVHQVDKWDSSQLEEEAALGSSLKAMDDKIDSSSSDSDSGVASSGSDSNIETSNGTLSRASPDIMASATTFAESCDSNIKTSNGSLSRASPDIMASTTTFAESCDSNIETSNGTLSRASPDILASTTTFAESCDSNIENGLHKLDIEISKRDKVIPDDTRGVGLSRSACCSSHDYICNITPQAKSISSTCGDATQCNIIYTNEVAKPPSNPYMNGQPDDRSTAETTSSVIKTDHCSCIYTTKSSPTSYVDASANLNSIDKDVCELNRITTTHVSTAASISVHNYCSDVSDKPLAASGLSGAKTNAAVVMPLLTCSTVTPSSVPASPSYATSSLALPQSDRASQDDPSAEITASGKGKSIYHKPRINHLSSASQTVLVFPTLPSKPVQDKTDTLPSYPVPDKTDTLLSNSVPDKTDTLPSNPVPDKTDTLPSNPVPDKTDTLPSNPVPDKTDTLPLNPVPDKTDTLPSNSVPDKTDTLPSNPVPDKTDTLLSNPVPDKTDILLSNPVPDKTDTLPSNPVPDKTDTLPSNPVPDKTDTLPSNPVPDKTDTLPSNPVPDKTDTPPSNIINCVSTPAASHETHFQKEIANKHFSISLAELRDNQGCEFLESPDPCPALMKEVHPAEASSVTPVCDIRTNQEFNSYQTNVTPVFDHPCVHNPYVQETSANVSSAARQNGSAVEHQQPDSVMSQSNSSMANEQIIEQTVERSEQCTEKIKINLQDDSNHINVTTSKSPPHVESLLENTECDNAAIIMNTFGLELSDLDIDLIIPHTYTSETFHSSESHWTENGNKKPAFSMGDNSSKNNLGNNNQRTFSTNNANNHPSEGKDEDLKTNYSAMTDADVIKFSFSTTSTETGSTKNLVVDTWESKKVDEEAKNLVNNIESSSLNQDSSANSSSVLSSEETNSSQSSTLKPSDSGKAKFDIGVWRKESLVQDRLQHGESSASTHSGSSTHFESQSLKAGHAVTNNLLLSSSDSKQQMSLDEDRNLQTFVGPSPCLIMQALTMSNANDFFSLERLETIGDSFLKYAITVYLYCSYPGIHEGKLSYLRSKQVSNYNLYRLGRRKCLAECMVSTKFEPYENWLPPGFVINEDRRRGPVPKVVIVTPEPKIANGSRSFYIDESLDAAKRDEALLFNKELEWIQQSIETDRLDDLEESGPTTLVPYSLQRHHGLPDKSVADCVEAFIGCYLTTCGRKAALMFMSWLGLKVLPKKIKKVLGEGPRKEDPVDKSILFKVSEQEFDELQCPPSPMFSSTPENVAQLEHLLEGFGVLEEKINYKFRDRSYLLQAFTHASYHYNTITDCYQRVEFLGDAILDYVITRHLYEDSQKYSPGILTDLRSALVNNNIFAALAVKWGFHKYFKAISPSLFQVIDKFVKRQKEKKEDDIDIDEEYRELTMEELEPEEANEDDDEEEEVEMEIPKALGDIFESVAGAIYLDSGMSLDTVWAVYYRMMKPHIDKYLKSIPKSPVRELLETEPETAKFERPERTMNGKVRVTVNVVGKGAFSGVGRNYRIAKSAAAKKALRSIRILNQNLIA